MASVCFRDLAASLDASLGRENDDDVYDAFCSWRKKQNLPDDVFLEMEFCIGYRVPHGFCVYVRSTEGYMAHRYPDVWWCDDGDEHTIAECTFKQHSDGWDIFTGYPVNPDTGVLLL